MGKQIVINNTKRKALFGKNLASLIGQDKRTNSFLLRKKPIGDEQIGFFRFSNPTA
jgi:hypothetical protein